MVSGYGRSKILGRCVDRNKKPWYRRYTDSLYGRTYRISWCSESGLSWYPYTTLHCPHGITSAAKLSCLVNRWVCVPQTSQIVCTLSRTNATVFRNWCFFNCCILRMVRSSTKFVSYKDLKAVCKDLKEVYFSHYSWCWTWCIGSIREEVAGISWTSKIAPSNLTVEFA